MQMACTENIHSFLSFALSLYCTKAENEVDNYFINVSDFGHLHFGHQRVKLVNFVVHI